MTYISENVGGGLSSRTTNKMEGGRGGRGERERGEGEGGEGRKGREGREGGREGGEEGGEGEGREGGREGREGGEGGREGEAGPTVQASRSTCRGTHVHSSLYCLTGKGHSSQDHKNAASLLN